MPYMIIYDIECDYTMINAENLEDCMIKFAEYVGDCSDLFLKALRGCKDVNDYVEMYNHFGQHTIQRIHIIEKTLYDITLKYRKCGR